MGGIVGAVLASGLTFAVSRATDHDTSSSPTSASSLTTPVTAAGQSPAGTAAGTSSGSGSGQLAGQPLDIHALLAKVEPSVVAIEIGAQSRSGTVQAVAAGSGVVISADGLILTNAHVVNPTDSTGRTIANPVLTVKLQDGTERPAQVLGASSSDDVALVKVTDATNLPPVTLGDSDALQVGDDVVAIGNALDLGATPTVTKGIVSAKNRSLEVDASLTLKGLLQIDAAINHGNSGGALVNAKGELVGINSAGITDAQNLGFAIAINTIKPLIDQLKNGSPASTGTVAVLGVTADLTAEGVSISSITNGSGAEKAGLQVGDIVTNIDGKDITTTTELGNAIRAHKPGEKVTLVVTRNGQSVTITATLGSRAA